MRATLLLVLTSTVAFHSRIGAQVSSVELQAGIGYARVFDAGGISFAAAVERSLSPATTTLQHALGGSFWYAHTGIASAPDDPYGRHLIGLGVRYQVAISRSRAFHPFIAVPIQLLLSNIPDRDDLAPAAMLVTGIPTPEAPRPIEDNVGGEWGWGTGLELGFRIGGGKRLSAQTSIQALYQNIYGAGSRNGAWNWHAGITYGLHGS
jgi:hypothetical protein